MYKICVKCKKKKSLTYFWKSKNHRWGLRNECKNCQKKRRRKWYKKISPEKREKIRIYIRKWNKKNKIKRRITSKKERKKLRRMVMGAYGKKCSCCNEKTYEFLGIDHIFGGGSKEKKRLNQDLYRYIIKSNYPKDK